MAKQLRLDVGQLTDVGLKREHNEDNMAYVMPNDPLVMAKKGSLFIVADGMGGHAAGEVASEIAVDTISTMYYQDDGDDVTNSLTQAIKRANVLIHQRAAENMLRSGMGTTCVAALLRGNMAYVANVGDSRAYLVRNGHVRQVSHDHSWVAEQVRAGLLTEEQARTHAQRNVITRCLGTQTDVEVDIFSEKLEENDELVLCTDGLSGLVSDDELLHIVEQTTPQESVYHLIERANQNGGPDNITAIVVRVQEVGWEPPGERRPVPVGGRENMEDTASVGPAPGANAIAGARAGNVNDVPESHSGMPLPLPVSPLAAPAKVAVASVTLRQTRRRRGRLFYPSLALLLLLLIAVGSAGAFYYQQSSNTLTVDQKLRSAQGAITQANSISNSDPVHALQQLASAQNTLRSLAAGSALSSDQRRRVTNLLQGDWTRQVRVALVNYNSLFRITTLPCQSTATMPVTTGTPGLEVTSMAQVQSNGKTATFALGSDGAIYELANNHNLVALEPRLFAPNVEALSMAGTGSQLVFLTAQSSGNSGTMSYSISLWSPGQAKADSVSVNAALIQNGQIPKILAISAPDVYLIFASTQTSTVVLDYTLKGNKLSTTPVRSDVSTSASIASVAAFPSHQLFLLLTTGDILSLAIAPGKEEARSVLLASSIAAPLPVSATAFTWQMSVPTVTTEQHSGTIAFNVAAAPGTLLLGVVEDVPHLFVMDAGLHRVLDLTVASGAVGVGEATPPALPSATATSGGGTVSTPASSLMLQLLRQYIAPGVFAQMIGMTVNSQTRVAAAMARDVSSSLNLSMFDTSSQSGCTPQ